MMKRKRIWPLVVAALVLLAAGGAVIAILTRDTYRIPVVWSETTTTASTTTTSATSALPDTKEPPTTDVVARQTTPAKVDMPLDVPYISQKDKFPTGCESVSAVMALRYLGMDITVDSFIDEHLACGKIWWENGELYGDDPNERFIGSPYSTASYGCFAPVIAAACRSAVSEKYEVLCPKAVSLPELAKTYVERGVPVLTWVTIDMKEPYNGSRWKLQNGATFQWPAGEHCMVLTGYDDSGYYFNDPYNGNGRVHIDRKLAETRYRQMGSQSVVILPK